MIDRRPGADGAVPASPEPGSSSRGSWGEKVSPVLVPTPVMDLATFLRFSIDDLFYADHDLERALDLLAVCGVDP